MKIEIKPLSVNQVWQGKRFKTSKYKAYESELLYRLPKLKVNPLNKLKITLVFGFSNKLSDIDNPVKPFLDCLQKKYNFDDRNIYNLIIKKEIVKKGKEFIEFKIEEI